MATIKDIEQAVIETMRGHEGMQEASGDDYFIRNFVRLYRTDDTTILVQEIVDIMIKEAEKRGFYVKNRSETVHRDLDEGDVVLFGFRLIRKLPREQQTGSSCT